MIEIVDETGVVLHKMDAASLENQNLAKLYLRGAQLAGVSLRGASLRGADLKEANLQGADLSDAKLEEADLRKANLTNANLGSATLKTCILEGAVLRGADLRSARIEDTQLKDVCLEGAQLEGITLVKVTICSSPGFYSKLDDANFNNAYICDLSRTGYLPAHRVNFSGAQLSGQNMRKWDLPNANFQRARLSYLDLSSSRLNGADFRDAELGVRVNLVGAELVNADFRGAKFDGTYDYKVNGTYDAEKTVKVRNNYSDKPMFWGADLAGANLTGCDLPRAAIKGAYFDWQTRWPKPWMWLWTLSIKRTLIICLIVMFVPLLLGDLGIVPKTTTLLFLSVLSPPLVIVEEYLRQGPLRGLAVILLAAIFIAASYFG